MTRRQLRERIFQMLFRLEFNRKEEWEEQLDFYLDELQNPATSIVIATTEETEEASEDMTDLDMTYIRQKVHGVFCHIEEIDTEIAEHTEGWALNRIGKTELAILRLAVYELLYDEDVPEKVAINEAVELTKQYCPEEAKGFVNAVLAKFTK